MRRGHIPDVHDLYAGPAVEGTIERVRIVETQQKGDLRTADRRSREVVLRQTLAHGAEHHLVVRVFVLQTPLQRALTHREPLGNVLDGRRARGQ